MTDTAGELGLTVGVLKGLLSKNERSFYEGKPIVVQVSNIKIIDQSPDGGNGESSIKYRVLLNDGQYSLHGLITSECVPYCEANGFRKTSVISVQDYNLVTTQKHIMIINSLEVKHQTSTKITGNITSCDAYYAEHPDEDFLELVKRNQIGDLFSDHKVQPPSNRSVSPSNGAAPKGASMFQQRQVNAIEQLSPYQNHWTIKARVSYKGDIRKWSNARGEGKLFNVNFLDESDEIRATAFNDLADKFYQQLEEGKVYYVSKARIQQSKPQFSHLSHPYELALDRDTVIEECFDTSNVPKIHFNFTKLNDIENAEANSIVDVIGVLKEVNPVFQITAKSTGKPFDRRNITIVDDSNVAITVGLWNTSAVDFTVSEGSVIAFKGCKIQDFAGRSLTLTHAGSMMVNPDTPEAYLLKGWFDNKGVHENFKSLKNENSTTKNAFSSRKSILQAQEENLGMSEKPDFFNIKATINFFKTENFCYPACNNVLDSGSQQLSNTCNRKVVEQSDGTWRCEKCDMNFAEPHYRYILNCSVMDSSGQLWITLFDQEAQKLFGIPAGELLKLKEQQMNGENGEFQKIINDVTMKEFNFRLKARQDSYNGVLRVRYQVLSISDVDFNAECEHLITQLSSMLN